MTDPQIESRRPSEGWVYDATRHELAVRQAIHDLAANRPDAYAQLAVACGLDSDMEAYRLLTSARVALKAERRRSGRTPQPASWYVARGLRKPLEIPDELPEPRPPMVEDLDNSVEKLVRISAASTQDVASRMWKRAAVTGVPLEVAAELATEVWRITGIEIEGNGGEIPRAMGELLEATRTGGRPTNESWNRVVVALGRLVRERAPKTGLPNKAVALILSYFGPGTVGMLRAGTADVVAFPYERLECSEDGQTVRVKAPYVVKGMQSSDPKESPMEPVTLKGLQDRVRETWREHGDPID